MGGEYFDERHTGHNNELVSAIITTHDREPGIVLRAVKSVLKQTYQNIELIVVDDSSPSYPQRAEVEQSVRGISDNILYLKHDLCRGGSAARNTGLDHANGYYVGFLDDDDEWMPTKIEEQIKGFLDDDIAMVYGRFYILNENNNRRYLKHSRGKSGHIFEALLKENIIGSTSNPLIKKECVKAVGGFDVKMQSCQDYDLWLRLALKYPMRFIDVPVIRYHVHSKNRISTDDNKRIKGIERLFLKYASYYDKDDEAWYARRVKLIPHYLRARGRKKTIVLWWSCVRKCPGNLSGNSTRLVRIALGNDMYLATKKRIVALHRGLRGDENA